MSAVPQAGSFSGDRGSGAKPAAAAERQPSVTLCIPTFRRPAGLQKLLSHVGRLTYDARLCVLVVENDAEQREGAKVVDEVASAFPFPLACIVEPRRGQTYAYNCGFVGACRAVEAPDYVAVLDDDEYPDPHWLAEMVATARTFAADIVGGPVFPAFDKPGHWLARSGLYEPVRYATGRVEMIYGAGSMLIRRDVLEQYLDEPFSHAFAFTGGSDYEFFTRCRNEGRAFAWADEAHVFETTPPARTTVGWLLRRHFRKGAEGSRIERRFNGHPWHFLARWYRGAGLIGYAVLSLPIAACRGRRAIMQSMSMLARGAGRIAAEFNILYEEYR